MTPHPLTPRQPVLLANAANVAVTANRLQPPLRDVPTIFQLLAAASDPIRTVPI